MSTFEIFAIAWDPISIGIVVGFVYLLVWLEDRAARRRAERAAEWGVYRN